MVLIFQDQDSLSIFISRIVLVSAAALCDRLLDYDEQVREKVVAAIYDVASHELTSISSQTTKQVAERLRDKSV